VSTELIERYLAMVANADSTPADFDDLLHAEMVFTERPNMFSPTGSVRPRNVMFEGMAKGRTILTGQSYEVRDHQVVDATHVVTRVLWRGQTSVDLGALPAGTTLSCDSAMFFEFRDGLIVAQENFDCFAPPAPPSS
jgi:ketosteroid isomerase-like protein